MQLVWVVVAVAQPEVSVAYSRRMITTGTSASVVSTDGAMQFDRYRVREFSPSASWVAPQGPFSPPQVPTVAQTLPSARVPLHWCAIPDPRSPAIARGPRASAKARKIAFSTSSETSKLSMIAPSGGIAQAIVAGGSTMSMSR